LVPQKSEFGHLAKNKLPLLQLKFVIRLLLSYEKWKKTEKGDKIEGVQEHSV
jgi:hypothetical protein